MRTIWKFPISARSQFTVSMPIGAEILNLQLQYGMPYIWAIVDDSMEKEIRKFFIVGTGDRLDEFIKCPYIGTYIQDIFVWHVFEDIN